MNLQKIMLCFEYLYDDTALPLLTMHLAADNYLLNVLLDKSNNSILLKTMLAISFVLSVLFACTS